MSYMHFKNCGDLDQKENYEKKIDIFIRTKEVKNFQINDDVHFSGPF